MSRTGMVGATLALVVSAVLGVSGWAAAVPKGAGTTVSTPELSNPLHGNPRGATSFGSAIPVVRTDASAGYLSEKSGIDSVSTTLEVPKITNCTSGHDTGMGPVVILIGSSYFVGAGAEAECQDGVTSYMVAINHNGTEKHPITIAARNRISVDVTIGATDVSVKIDDLTTKKAATESVPKATVTAAELGDDSLSQGGQQVPIPRFTDHQFKDAKINGSALKKAAPLFDEKLVSGSTVLIQAGPIKGGDKFVMHFKHAT
jgi:hypothetical protein